MNIGIDISQIVYEGTGVSRFTRGLTNAILNLDKKNRWTFLFSSLRRKLDSEIESEISKKGHELIKWKIPLTLLAYLCYDWRLISKYLITHFAYLDKLDYFVTSDWVELPLKVKKTTVVHDLVFLRHPETVSPEIKTVQTKRLELVKRESQIIFADSNATKADLSDYLSIDKNRIFVNYPGVDVRQPTSDQINLTIKKYDLKKPFILTVGKLEPRKNLHRLIAATKQLNNEAIDLVIVGPKGWGKNNLKTEYSNIKFLGMVDDNDLYCLYSSCLLFIYPSLWEGFGFPVVEAMGLGAAVATSNTSSLKEIVGDAALLFNPQNTTEISQSLNTLLTDSKLRASLAKKGKKRSTDYSWKNYFNKFIKILTNK
ncbi:hypothetical protein A2774_03820 [Candidatus Roizmanbacteria bacterium RIFCSPHIGHO2_01_FULL_39_12c]|uniref:Glycosyl transferase family 1 domain-containing protein n=1 Tax=Candidatus Roizmanbacteria bacterium RIFCSPHIGHO2_01_FULL_39_12c TaxID=1802031 RepID=A0A1F7GEL5_9BACT|nr:MAG: hypothetical protein A2774_03820 [Candidatus Roizmanbacteria bacterium RIFCSPHIGHO2_01_FULL_39_12c]OGK47966.1 MAG: hypothetical protein A2963_00030 [Candidatus Roizmanbacteria bacterium RIFCSPLOWO2_01_FULL_40_13]